MSAEALPSGRTRSGFAAEIRAALPELDAEAETDPRKRFERGIARDVLALLDQLARLDALLSDAGPGGYFDSWVRVINVHQALSGELDPRTAGRPPRGWTRVILPGGGM